MDLKRAIIDLMPGPLVRTFAAPYISGKGIASGVAKADELHAKLILLLQYRQADRFAGL